uniref:Uncharacterized protein n=1 Tax=Onchocerca volvulus TaxID=6282 RepID=A0A8R1TRB1_ONCVO
MILKDTNSHQCSFVQNLKSPKVFIALEIRQNVALEYTRSCTERIKIHSEGYVHFAESVVNKFYPLPRSVIKKIQQVTCIVFWSLYAMEPTLIVPEWAEKLIPPFMNHITHTASLPFILVDTLLTCHRAPSRKTGSIIVVAESIDLQECAPLLARDLHYDIEKSVLGVRYFNGYWIYPFLEYLSAIHLIIMFFMALVFTWLLYIVGDTMNIMLWGGATHSILSEKGK